MSDPEITRERSDFLKNQFGVYVENDVLEMITERNDVLGRLLDESFGRRKKSIVRFSYKDQTYDNHDNYWKIYQPAAAVLPFNKKGKRIPHISAFMKGVMQLQKDDSNFVFMIDSDEKIHIDYNTEGESYSPPYRTLNKKEYRNMRKMFDDHQLHSDGKSYINNGHKGQF